eukprot:TRINITY_DN11644_c0_g1_i1.p1 TRINITY_DN11644_c0_g1~~TRINITY_DN11644_c0_g1_i1.p1  ORF type:complete len:396 (+),score=165.53 TRINITY_DN11644_c0_g1_i1:14-1201(+)
MSTERTLFLLAGYTNKSALAHNPAGGEGDGFYAVVFDPNSQDDKFKLVSSSKLETNPAFILKHHTLDLVYLTTEVIDTMSELITAKVDRSTGEISVLDRKIIGGRSSCHLAWDKDQTHLVAVSYWDARLTTFPVDKEGMVGEAVTLYKDPGADYVDTNNPDRDEHLQHRQRWPHLHQVNLDPYSEQFFMIPDLGRDQIQFFDITAGNIHKLGQEQLRAGLGPRHLEFNRKLKVVYVCGELDNTINVYRYNETAVENFAINEYTGDSQDSSPDNLLFFIQSLSTVPDTWNTKSTVAEMRLHPSGDWMYVGNRGHNSIAVYAVNKEDGTLTLVQIKDSEGIFPRHFNFDLSSKYLVAANHCSDSLVAFAIKPDGKLEQVARINDIPSIVWVAPVEIK